MLCHIEGILTLVKAGSAVEGISVAVKSPFELELDLAIGKDGVRTLLCAVVLEGKLPYFASILTNGNKNSHFRGCISGLILYFRVAHTLSTLVGLIGVAHRLPVYSPELTRFIISYVNETVVKMVLTEYVVVTDTANACIKLNAFLTVDLVVEAAYTCLMNICIAGIVEKKVVKGTGCGGRGYNKLVAGFIEITVFIFHFHFISPI